MAKRVLINFEDDMDYPMIAKTNMNKEQIKEAYTTEAYDEDNLDVEMKMLRYAEENGLKFKRLNFKKILI